MSHCSKPGCTDAGAVVLGYDYAGRVASLEDPGPEAPNPHVYVLCTGCAERLRPPRGWTLEDHRRRPPLFATGGETERTSNVVGLPSARVPEKLPERRQLFFGSSA